MSRSSTPTSKMWTIGIRSWESSWGTGSTPCCHRAGPWLHNEAPTEKFGATSWCGWKKGGLRRSLRKLRSTGDPKGHGNCCWVSSMGGAGSLSISSDVTMTNPCGQSIHVNLLHSSVRFVDLHESSRLHYLHAINQTSVDLYEQIHSPFVFAWLVYSYFRALRSSGLGEWIQSKSILPTFLFQVRKVDMMVKPWYYWLTEKHSS